MVSPRCLEPAWVAERQILSPLLQPWAEQGITGLRGGSVSVWQSPALSQCWWSLTLDRTSGPDSVSLHSSTVSFISQPSSPMSDRCGIVQWANPQQQREHISESLGTRPPSVHRYRWLWALAVIKYEETPEHRSRSVSLSQALERGL